MNLSSAFFSLLIFPGLLYALPAGWLMLGLVRKLKARFQGRIGPPLYGYLLEPGCPLRPRKCIINL